MKPPINYMILHNDALADEFDAILGYRAILAGVVLPVAVAPDPDLIAILWENSDSILWEDSSPIDWES